LRFTVLVAALSVAVAVATTLALVRPAASAAPSSTAPGPAAMTITTAQAQARTWPERLTVAGAIAPWHESVLGSPSDGLRLASVEAVVGQVVRHGQVLARFDDALLRADAARLEALLAQAQAQAEESEANAQRALHLRPSGAISEQSILQATTRARTDAAAVRSARAALQARRVEIAQAVLRAPDDGVISERTASLGAVPASGEPLFRLIRQQRLEWRGELTAGQLGRVRPGQTVVLHLPDGRDARATVRQLAPGLADRSRLGWAYADLLPGSSASAGMYAEGTIEQTLTPALVVPAASVVVRDGRSLVFEVDATDRPGQVIAREVRTGRRQDTEVEIVSGLAEGTRVAVSGAGLLADGDRVDIAGSPALASNASALQPEPAFR